MLGGLQRFDGVDVNQGTMHRTVGFRISDDDERLENHDVLRVANLMGFTVGKPEHERLERAPTQPFSQVFCTHSSKCTTVDSE